jgi:hypothetical protein
MEPTTRIHDDTREIKQSSGELSTTNAATRPYISNSKRGLGPEGGGWNVAQAAHWSGFNPAHLRQQVKDWEAGKEVDIFPYYRCGRRVLIPREGFKTWFNKKVNA